MSTLSTPMPKRETIRQRFICWIISAVIFAYVTRRASAAVAARTIASGVGPCAICNSAPIADSTSRAGTRLGKTESETTTRYEDMSQEPRTKDQEPSSPSHRFIHVFHARENDWAFRRDEHVLFQAAGLLEPRMPRERLDREVHVLFDLGGILQRIGPRNPHALVERDADAVRELLQRHRPVLVVVVFGERLRHVRGRLAGPQVVEAGVHRVVDLSIQIDLLLRHLRPVRPAALEAAHEVDEVA